MLCLNDFVAGRKGFYNLSRGLCISASKHSTCRKMKFRTPIHLTLVNRILLLVVKGLIFILSGPYLSWNTVGR